MLGAVLGGAWARSVPAAAPVDLALSAGRLVAGSTVEASGTLRDPGPDCLAGRAVTLQHRPAGGSAWSPAATATTGGQGGFGPVDLAPMHSGEVRAVVAAENRDGVTCVGGTSAAMPVIVAAAATIDPPAPVEAFRCRVLVLRVAPAKPGTTVRLQARTSTGVWRTLATRTLGPASSARVRRCFGGWAAIGTRTYRAWWPGGDRLNAPGLGGARQLAVVKAKWMRTIDATTAGHAVSVSVRDRGRFLFRRADEVARTPASNEKLLLSMALLDRLPSTFRIPTRVAAKDDATDGVISSSLWIIGRGDPGIDAGEIAVLARGVAGSGVTRVRGRVMGSTGYFARDWFAPGWRSYFPDRVIALPTALTYEGNRAGWVPVARPERRAAWELRRRLKALGVAVSGTAGAGRPPAGLRRVGATWSPPLSSLLTAMNVDSRNFYAEVLNKLLSVRAGTAPGTIAGGAAAIEAYAAARGVTVTAHDGSGLSYANRATAVGLARLLGQAQGEPWGAALAASLARPGRGTLEHRLFGVPVRAKTGTLQGISALSGYVFLTRTGSWAEFAILSRGMPKSQAVPIENKIVTTLWRYGR
jgi:D-alanyl-D-alanine carboxypeptidase